MPNVTWQEPQIMTDLLALNLYAFSSGLALPGPRELAIVSPWLSNIELAMRPGNWYQLLTLGETRPNPDLLTCVQVFRDNNWRVQLAVLAYGTTNTSLAKRLEDYEAERRWLRLALELGAEIYLAPNLHAKGIVTPLGIITGSTNLTYSGLYAQSQNANYFPHDHPEYADNRAQLLGRINICDRATVIP